jgi:hypothetical protein
MQYSVLQTPCQEPEEEQLQELEEEEQVRWRFEEIGTMANRERNYMWMQEMAIGLSTIEKDTLRRCGLYRASQTRLCRFDQALCREVIGYWDDVSHMFRFPHAHMTITLEDIYRLLGVPVTGATPTYTVPDDYDLAWAELTEQDAMDRLAPGNRQGVNLIRHGLLGCANLKKVIMAVMESRLIQSQTAGLLPVETYMLVRGCLRGETYDWGGYVLARVYEQLSRVRRNRGGGLACTSVLQAWVWEHFPPLRSGVPTHIRGHQARLLRWDTEDRRRAAIGRREITRMVDIQVDDIVWEPYQGVEWREDEQMCLWFDRTEVRGRLRNRDNHVMVHPVAQQRRIEERVAMPHHQRLEQVAPQGGEQGAEVPHVGQGQEAAPEDLTGLRRYTIDDIGTFLEWMTTGLWVDEAEVRVVPVPPFREDARVFARVQRAVETIQQQRQEIAHLRGEIAGLTHRRE